MMIRDFGLNTNLLETNVLNLRVVLRLVFVFVGDAFSALLTERRGRISSTIEDTERRSEKILIKVKMRTETRDLAEIGREEVRKQVPQLIAQEKLRVATQLEIDIRQFQDKRNQALEMARKQNAQRVAEKIFNLAFASSERILMQGLQSKKLIHSKQKELNEIYLRRIGCQLKSN
jgi:F-type H+-transporting ATPase subunit b